MKKFWKITLIVLAVLIVALHFILEPVALHYANKALANLDGYRGKIHDIDIHLYRGAYRIDSLDIAAVGDDSTETPFFSVNGIDISLEWKALFKGSIAGEFVMEHPVLSFKTTPSEEVEAGGDNDFVQVLQDLIPIKINRFEVIDGEIHYLDPYASPSVDVYVHHLDAVATNLSNVDDLENPLPSRIHLTAQTIGDGWVNTDVRLNVLKSIPDLDLNFEIRDVSLPALESFTEAYAGFNFREGILYASSEMAIKDGAFSGYLKPVLEEYKVIDLQNDEKSFFRKAWEVVVGATLGVFKNQRKDRFATEVPFSGNLNQTDVRLLPSVFGVLKNAFIRAFEKDVNRTIDFSDAKTDQDPEKREKKKD